MVYAIADKICRHLKHKQSTKDKIFEMLDKERVLQDVTSFDFRLISLRPFSLKKQWTLHRYC
jgi:hypothetical protein